jgi:hypothetical protein
LSGLEREEAEHLLVCLAQYEQRIGDLEERFANAVQAGNYLGLAPRVSISGSIINYGHITKRGNGYLRALLVQGAWAITWSKDGGALRERYEYMTAGPNGKNKKNAIAASNRRFAARRLAGLMWTLLKKGEDYEVRRFKRPADKKRETEALVQSAISA